MGHQKIGGWFERAIAPSNGQLATTTNEVELRHTLSVQAMKGQGQRLLWAVFGFPVAVPMGITMFALMMFFWGHHDERIVQIGHNGCIQVSFSGNQWLNALGL